MNPNSEQHVEIDSSVTSFSHSFGQLEMNPITGDGPINRLPNELMQLIFAKFNLGGDDVKKLLRLRLVSTKWKLQVEVYCQLTKSLFVDSDQIELSLSDSSYIEKRFFGFANLKNFVCLFFSYKMPFECLRSLLNLFPNLVQLSIYWKYDTHVPDLVTYINSLDCLKQLDFKGPFAPSLTDISSTLSKLEHISFDIENLMNGSDDDDDHHQQVVAQLGPSCARIDFGVSFNHDHILQWHNINPLWLTNLTHLRIRNTNSSVNGSRSLYFLCEHAISLKHLSFKNVNFVTLKLTPILIDNLRKLANLTELELRPIEMDIFELGQAIAQHRPISLSSVLTYQLFVSVCFVGKDDQFTPETALSAIFPNVADLNRDVFVLNFCSRCAEIPFS